jgi:hypothetical protein
MRKVCREMNRGEMGTSKNRPSWENIRRTE